MNIEEMNDWLVEEIGKHRRMSTTHAENGEYENAQYQIGIAEGLQLVWDKLNIKKEGSK